MSGLEHLPDVGGFEDGIQVQVTRSTAEKGSTDAEHLFYAPSPAPGSEAG